MRNLVKTCLPVLALFALGGCAGTSALTSSEDDGVYYSSKDRTTAVVQPAPAPASASEEANPDYNGNTATAPQGSGSTAYYDNTYTYMRGVPGYGSSSYYGPGLGGYAPYSPYTTLGYAPFASTCYGFGYGWGGGGCGFSPYAYGGGYGSYYSPYGYGYSPYYGYGSGLSISFGFGSPYYGGYGYSPYGYGYGGGYGYSPYYYGSSYYGGYYGRGGYYGGSYYGNNGYGNNGYGGDNRGRGRTSGHRTDRASEGSYGTAAAPAPAGGGNTSGHVRSPRMAGGSQPDPLADATDGTRRGRDRALPADGTPPGGSYNQPRPLDSPARARYRDTEAPVAADPNGSRPQPPMGQPQNQPQDQPNTTPQDGGRRRGGFFRNGLGEPGAGAGQAAEPARQRSYEPARQQTYEQPRQQTYEPQRSSQPSYSAPSYGGGGGGGGNSGGGGHRGRD